MDNMGMNNTNLNSMDMMDKNNQINAEQHSSFMRYLEQASIQSASDCIAQEMMIKEETAAVRQVQKNTSRNINLFDRKKSVLNQIPNIQNITVPGEEIKFQKEKKSEKNPKIFVSIPFIKKKESPLQDNRQISKDNLTEARKLAEKASLKEIDVLEWIVMYFISYIPIANIVVLSMWAAGKTIRPEIINWAKANLIIIIVTYIFIGISIYVTLWDVIKVFLP